MRIEQIRSRLAARFEPVALDVVDESHLHAGHAGARSGKGHFRLRIVAPAFAGQAPLERHRMIYDALGELMSAEIHALSIEALTPAEAGARGPS